MKSRLLHGMAGSALALILLASAAHAADELNALVWCDHSDPNLLKPFEDANGVKVNVKETARALPSSSNRSPAIGT